jgi:hypothetical protein
MSISPSQKKEKKEKEKHSITRKFAMVDMAQVFY